MIALPMPDRLRQRALPQFLLLAIAVVGSLPLSAQGPVYRERWGYMHLERRRAQLFEELEECDVKVRRRVTEIFARPYDGRPFLPVAEALALARGVEADAAFILRTALAVFLLPEIVDPESTNEQCRSLNASLYLPFSVESPGELAFVATVHDGEGEKLFEQVVTKNADINGLRRARPAVIVPGADLPNGTFTLTVRTLVDGVEPTAKDPVLRHRFHVLRGYQKRAEAAMTRTREIHAELPVRERGLLLGITAEVSRAYQGVAFPGESPAWLDLERTERALANLAAGKHVLHGMTGDVPIQLPVGDDGDGDPGSNGPPLAALLRIHGGNRFAADPQAEREARPLAVVVAGLPTLDAASVRPSSPPTGLPRSTALALPDLGAEAGDGFDVAFLESPGGGRDYFRALPAALAELRGILGSSDRPVVLIAEREAATVAGLAIARLDEIVDGVLLIGSGGLPGNAIDALDDLTVGYAVLGGYPATDAIDSTLRYVELQRKAGKERAVTKVASDRPAWPFALAGHRATIARFVARVVGGQ